MLPLRASAQSVPRALMSTTPEADSVITGEQEEGDFCKPSVILLLSMHIRLNGSTGLANAIMS
jgi:hypothetical protein